MQFSDFIPGLLQRELLRDNWVLVNRMWYFHVNNVHRGLLVQEDWIHFL